MTREALIKRKEQTQRPLIIVHCGSINRAKASFEEWRLKDTLAGYIVLTIGASKHNAELGITLEQAIQLNTLHLYKIDLNASR
jgi:hypothetical protein